MRKSKETTEIIKAVIRDQLALQPAMSVNQIQIALYNQGLRSASGGFLDWHYISKLIRRVRLENVARLSSESRLQRISEMKERTNKMISLLMEIVEGRRVLTDGEIVRYPTQSERIAAANTISKLDAALFFVEETARKHGDNLIEKPEPLFLKPKMENKTKKWAKLLPKIIS